MSKFAQFHPLLRALLDKLSDKQFTTRDAWGERFDWVKAGCPVWDNTPVKEDPLVRCRLCHRTDYDCHCAGYTG